MNTFLSPDIIFFVLVAAILILRLRSVLGRKTGNEKRPKDIFMYQDTTLGNDKNKTLGEKKSIKSKFDDKLFTGKENNSNKKTALEKICYFDKNFSTRNFLLGAKIAFQKIIQFYAKGEINKIKHF